MAGEITVHLPDPVEVTVSPTAGTPVVVTGMGARGLSAYEIWRLQGNTGTEQDFLSSLASGGLSPGPGLKIVGSELRYDFSSLTRG